MDKKPYTHFQVSRNSFIRTFNETVSHEELIWHRDKKDRTVYVIYAGSGWKLQLDNELPSEMISNYSVFKIEKGMYHRLIKGQGACIIYIEEK